MLTGGAIVPGFRTVYLGCGFRFILPLQGWAKMSSVIFLLSMAKPARKTVRSRAIIRVVVKMA
jgi:hypothetical protein